MYLTPSGMLYEDDFRFCLKKVGTDRIIWSTDYPYQKPENSKSFLSRMQLSVEERENIAFRNAEKLFRMGEQP